MKHNIEYIHITNNNIKDVISFLNERGCKISINDIFTTIDGYYINARTKKIYKVDDAIIYHIDTKQFEIMPFDEYVNTYYNQIEYIKNHKPIIIQIHNDDNNNIIDKYQFEYEIEDEIFQKKIWQIKK